MPQINHKNGDKSNNRIENLEWITNLDNMRHAWKNGLKNNNYQNGEKSHFAKITEELVRKIKQDYMGLRLHYLALYPGARQKL